ncbi:MAG: TonB-dependent receptor, partial [candidate division KSB1 bacterium]
MITHIDRLLCLLAVFLFAANSPMPAQSQFAGLTGTVTDISNGETLPGAHVLIPSLHRGVAADRYGRFFFSNISPGRYELRVSFLGYATFQDSVTLTAGKNSYVRIALKPHPLALTEITVSAERDRLTKEVNLGREFIDAQKLRMTSVVIEPDLFRTLALLPGVAQANDFNSRFYVRGGSSNENHVLVEGMTIHNPYHALGFFSTFDVDAIKAVEVHRGIFPVRYTERLSSVTNVILRDGNAQQFCGLGMVSLASSKFLLEGPLRKYQPESGRKWTFMLNGRQTYLDKFTGYPLAFYDLSGKSVYDSGRKTRVTMHGFYGYDQLSGEAEPFPFPKLDYADIRWNNHALGLQWQQFLGKGSI